MCSWNGWQIPSLPGPTPTPANEAEWRTRRHGWKWKPKPNHRMVRRRRQGGGSQAHPGNPPNQDALQYLTKTPSATEAGPDRPTRSRRLRRRRPCCRRSNRRTRRRRGCPGKRFGIDRKSEPRPAQSPTMHGHDRKANRDPARRNIRNLAAGIRRHAHRIDTSQRTRRVCPSWRRRWRGRRRRRLDADERTTARRARQRDMVHHPGRRHLPQARKRRDHRSAARHGRRRGHDGPHAQAPGNVRYAPYFDGAFPGWRATTAGEKRRADTEHCCSATRCDYSPTTTSPCSKQLFCTRRRRPKTNHKKAVPITERRLNIQPGQRHEAHHIPDGPKALLGVRIAPGGEGSVHEVSGNQDIVAIYHQGRRPPEIEEKLRQMVSRPPGGNAPDGVAWPWARFVADRDGQTHGYLMQRAKPGAMPAAVFRS